MSYARKRPRRGRRVDATGRSIGKDRYLGLPHYLLSSEAWRDLSPNERALFVEVAQRYNGQNNGKIGLGVREAGEALHVRPQTAGDAFRRLVENGFLRIGRDSAFNVKSRLAREWFVTLFPVGDDRATHDFMRWRSAVAPSKTQMRNEPLTVPIEDTLGNKSTSDEDGSGHRESQMPPSNGGLDRTTYISH